MAKCDTPRKRGIQVVTLTHPSVADWTPPRPTLPASSSEPCNAQETDGGPYPPPGGNLVREANKAPPGGGVSPEFLKRPTRGY